MRRMLTVVLLAVGMVVGTASAAQAARSDALALPGSNYFPESIAVTPNGALFVSSLTTGQIVRFAPGSSKPQTFVPAGVNIGTAGLMVDPLRGVLWACAVDLSFQTPSYLEAFDLATGVLRARYQMPDNGVCADIALAWGNVYVTDTGAGRIDRLTGTDPFNATGGTLSVWSADPQLGHTGVAPLKVNGIAFDGRRTFFTTNYGTGELFAVAIAPDGTAGAAAPIALNSPLVFPDGIRWCGGYLYVAENAVGVSRVDVRQGTHTVIDTSLDQPSSLVFDESDTWITEGQVLRLQLGQAPNLPFKVVRRPAPVGCSA